MINHLLHGLPGNFPVTLGTMGTTDPGEQQPQVVVNFSHRAHRRPRVLTGGSLVNGNSRRQAFNIINVGLVHLPQELAGVGRERLDIAALTLGINGIEGQGGFPRATQAGDHHQLVAGDRQVNIFKIMFTGAFDDNFIEHFSSV